MKNGLPRFFSLEMLAVTLAALSALVMLWAVTSPTVNIPVMIGAGTSFMLALAFVLRLLLDPDSVRARQSDAMLQLASDTFDVMREGLTHSSAQQTCEILLKNTDAIAVSITDREIILGYAGFEELVNPTGSKIYRKETIDGLAGDEARSFPSADEIGLVNPATINAAIVAPITVGDDIMGTLRFYYRSSRKITETQRSIAQGFGKLLSTQLEASEAEKQRKLATSMELKMLQSQINPHFLFNTINTIASLVRTDPMKARTLLRDFAVFYRRTLEDSSERILLSREIEQTMRYFSFELARFGDERLALCIGVDPEVRDMLVPPFIMQPIVENAVRHAMPSEGKLTIKITAEVEGDDIVVVISDDGVGMSEETRDNIMNSESSTGMGIAVRNVHDRMKGYFGKDAEMHVDSELGVGTTITLRFPDCAVPAMDSTEGSVEPR